MWKFPDNKVCGRGTEARRAATICHLEHFLGDDLFVDARDGYVTGPTWHLAKRKTSKDGKIVAPRRLTVHVTDVMVR